MNRIKITQINGRMISLSVRYRSAFSKLLRGLLRIQVLGLLILLQISLLGNPSAIEKEEYLRWSQDLQKLDANIDTWTLSDLLKNITSVTGWQVYVEPNTQFKISARFSQLDVGTALQRLLGNLNYALLPQTAAPAKLFVFRSSISEATVLIPSEKSSVEKSKKRSLIGNELVVTLKRGSPLSIEALAKELGAKIVGRADELNTYRLQFEDETSANRARQVLSSNSDVSSVDANYYMNNPSRAQPFLYSSVMPLNLKLNTKANSNQLIIGLIDTTVQVLPDGLKDFMLPSISVAGETASNKQGLTHGSSMAETILRGLSLAPQPEEGTSARILPIDVYGTSENTTTFDVANGIMTAVKNGATIINLSMGGDGDSTFLYEVIHQAHQQGVVFVAAAGNEPVTTATYPAAYPEVIATTAGDKKGQLASYANRGSFVDVVAPGNSIVTFNNQSFYVSGTSPATAYISGITAGIAISESKTAANVEQKVRSDFAFKP